MLLMIARARMSPPSALMMADVFTSTAEALSPVVESAFCWIAKMMRSSLMI